MRLSCQTLDQFLEACKFFFHPIECRGIAIAMIILFTWTVTLVKLLTLELYQMHWLWITVAIFGMTFLYTGLFITAHDAMHGSLAPQYPKLNECIGTLVLLLYAGLPYQSMLKAHRQHHQYPASDRDPDFHGDNQYFLSWYLRFMRRYLGIWQLLSIALTYHSLHRLIHISESNLILFWAIPAGLSSLQLFYFGTFLVHRETATGYVDSYRAHSFYHPLLISLLICYHFGCHREHHQQPHIPWWQLPSVVK
jgi:beta-carotene/zeaxanthin 4-ketolase